jgi:hypothetical protein
MSKADRLLVYSPWQRREPAEGRIKMSAIEIKLKGVIFRTTPLLRGYKKSNGNRVL